jgi:hypothetical protein
MALIKNVTIQNFKCYRKKQSFDLNRSTFFVGANNSGKSAVLKAIHCFFKDSEFVYDYINKTELRSKAEGFNRSIIGLTFNSDEISSKTMRESLVGSYGKDFTFYKQFIFRERSNTVAIEYIVGTETYSYDQLPEIIRDFLRRIVVSYIHPQEAQELLTKAQDKLRTRLISNWGKTANLGETLRQLQIQWDDLRSKANSYLSNGLTQNLQNIWPGCETRVNLPDRIQDVIGISEIMFKGSKELPDVSLTSQGTGAQSTILFQTHFLLDSDKTLHRGFYYPVWLIEEPESFLHGDIIHKLGALLCSEEWLSKIQMLISTHSPILLSTSKRTAAEINWYLLNNYNIQLGKTVTEWTKDEITLMGSMMGDPNFDIYFNTNDNILKIFIEDSRKLTAAKYIEAGIKVSDSLNNNSEQKRYFDVLRKIDFGKPAYFLVDNDKGKSEYANLLTEDNLIKTTKDGFKKYKFENDVYIILFPDRFAAEELFKEHDTILEDCASKIFNAEFTRAATDKSIPHNLTRAHSEIRNKKPTGKEDAKEMIRNNQDVKDIFWKEVETKKYSIDQRFSRQIQTLIQ